MQDSPPRSSLVTLLALICLAMGAWGLFFSWHVHLAFGQLTRGIVLGKTLSLVQKPRAPSELWVVGYCVLSALLMSGGGLGLLLRRRWGPRVVALAGVAWTISALASLSYHVNVAWTLRPSMQPQANGLRWMLASYAAASLVAFVFGIICAGYPLRARLRPECGDGRTPPGSLATLAFGLWGLLSAAAAGTCTLHFWYSVLD